VEVTLEWLKDWLDDLLCGEYILTETPLNADLELQAIGERMQRLSLQVEQLNEYALAIAHGNLEAELPSPDNYLSGCLKELHTNMLQLVWKVEQIARGNYSQKLDYMGQFSDAFNQMALMLAKRDLQLSQSQKILEIILSFADISLFVLEKGSGAFLYGRESLNTYNCLADMPLAAAQLLRQLQDHNPSVLEKGEKWQLYSSGNDKWYMVNSMPGVWNNRKDAYFHVLNNISATIALSERLQHAMYRDAKFPVYNQLHAVEYLGNLMRTRSPFALCYFDLDNFKRINDLKGHDEGDRYILNFIDKVGGVIRSHDVLCRIGGDEFLLILTGITVEGVEGIIARLTEKIAELNHREHSDIPLDFSYGIEMVSADNYEPEGLKPCLEQGCRDKHCGAPQCVISRADHKMYEQKRRKNIER